MRGGCFPVQRIKKPYDRGGYWDYKFNFYGPNGTVIELIVVDGYILGVKEGLGHALYDYTRQIGEILGAYAKGKLDIERKRAHLLKVFNNGLKAVSDEIYSNPQFDLESMSKALSASMTLVSSGQLPLAGLSTNFDKVLSKDNMTSWPKLLEKARNLQTSSSSQYDSKPLYPSKSSRLNAMGASNDNVASGSYWGLVYDDVAGRLFSDRLFSTDDYGDAVDASERIVQVVSSWKDDAKLTKAQEEVRSEILARLFEGYLYDGKTFSPKLKTIFAKLAQWMRRVYKGMETNGVTLTDDIVRAYDQILADRNSGLAETEGAKASVLGQPVDRSPMETVFLADEARVHAKERQGIDFGNYETVEAYLKKTVRNKDLTNKSTGITARISSTGINKSLSNKAVSKSYNNGFSRAQHYEAVTNIAKIFEESVQTSIGKDKKGSPDIKAVMRFEVPVVFQDAKGDKTNANAYLTVKESVQQGARIYSLELKELKKEPSATGGELGSDSNLPHAEDLSSSGLSPRSDSNIASDSSSVKPDVLGQTAEARQRDQEYLEAVNSGDLAKARRMVEQEARRKGYSADDSFRGAHHAPSASVPKEDFLNLDKIRKALPDSVTANIYAIANGVSMVPSDYFGDGGARRYGVDNETGGPESYFNVMDAIRKVRRLEREGKDPSAVTMEVYRAVPNDVREGSVRSGGEWVSPSRDYAVQHGRSRFGNGNYHVIKDTASVADL